MYFESLIAMELPKSSVYEDDTSEIFLRFNRYKFDVKCDEPTLFATDFAPASLKIGIVEFSVELTSTLGDDSLTYSVEGNIEDVINFVSRWAIDSGLLSEETTEYSIIQELLSNLTL